MTEIIGGGLMVLGGGLGSLASLRLLTLEAVAAGGVGDALRAAFACDDPAPDDILELIHRID